MLKKEIVVGAKDIAKVSGKLTTVRVDNIRKRASGYGYTARDVTVYDVTNLITGRTTTFRSAAKFMRPAKATIPLTTLANMAMECAVNPGNRTVIQLPKTETMAQRLAKELAGSQDNSPHLIIEARAGTGKTTTLIEGLKRIKGLPSQLVPSPQQALVWEAMEQSRGKAQSICFVAFNKSIATELQQRVPEGCDAMTMHSLGFKAINRAFTGIKVNSYRVQDIIAELLECDIRQLRRDKPVLIKATEELVGLCKMNLVGVFGSIDALTIKQGEEACWQEALSDLASYYDVDLNGNSAEVFNLVPKVLERCKDVAIDACIDFNDMIWLPVALGLPVYCYDLLLIDESQDLNRCQQALARKAGKRLILCGDPKQAIYGFAGADSRSMARMAEELNETNRGCRLLPLTVTRRCGKAIVTEANKLVPDFEAFETNPDGAVYYANFKGADSCKQSYQTIVQNGDMVLCRVNAPLISECFRFLKQGRKANIQGRDIGQGLIGTINKQKATSVPDLITKLGYWLERETSNENAKKNPSESRLVNLQDRHDCLLCFCENQASVESVIAKINEIFTDDKNGAGIRLSSVHKAKGLEADKVFVIRTKAAPMPHPMAKTAWEKEQENNILYVAITRAINHLVYVVD